MKLLGSLFKIDGVVAPPRQGDPGPGRAHRGGDGAVPPSTSVSDGPAEASSFAESVAGVIGRHGPAATGGWVPGSAVRRSVAGADRVARRSRVGDARPRRRARPVRRPRRARARPRAWLRSITSTVCSAAARSPVTSCARFGVERLVRRRGERRGRAPADRALASRVRRRRGSTCTGSLELGDAVRGRARRRGRWHSAPGLRPASGYLAGLGQGALDLTVDYVRQRRAFGSTLAALGPVQQLLAGAATAVRGVRLLAGEGPDADALAHAGPAIARRVRRLSPGDRRDRLHARVSAAPLHAASAGPGHLERRAARRADPGLISPVWPRRPASVRSTRPAARRRPGSGTRRGGRLRLELWLLGYADLATPGAARGERARGPLGADQLGQRLGRLGAALAGPGRRDGLEQRARVRMGRVCRQRAAWPVSTILPA